MWRWLRRLVILAVLAAIGWAVWNWFMGEDASTGSERPGSDRAAA